MYELCDISNFNAVTGKHFPEIIAAIDANFAPANYNLGYVAESSPISCWFDLTLSFEHYDFGMPTAGQRGSGPARGQRPHRGQRGQGLGGEERGRGRGWGAPPRPAARTKL